jgi:preprotein translocase subunit Sss1
MMLKKLLTTVCLGTLSVCAFAADQTSQGTRLANYEKELRRVYPEASKIEEYSFVPAQWGGISLMGLIGRLVGDRASPFETINTRRYLYRAYKGDDVLGVTHGSSTQSDVGPMDLYVYYNSDSSVRDVRLDRAPTAVVQQLSEGGYLKQFINRPAEDFTVTIGKKGRVKDWGNFSREARRPKDKELSGYFDRIVRSMRFNAAFVEVAYFVGQHPKTEEQTAKLQ